MATVNEIIARRDQLQDEFLRISKQIDGVPFGPERDALQKQQSAIVNEFVASKQELITAAAAEEQQATLNSASGQTADQQITNNPDSAPPPAVPDSAPVPTGDSGFAPSGSALLSPEVAKLQSAVVAEPPSPPTPTVQEPPADTTATAKSAGFKTNTLHDYTSYSYRLTLYLLTAEDYTSLINSPGSFQPKYPLISSGGAHAAEKGNIRTTTPWGGIEQLPERHPDFQEDFFIDNLSLVTIVGLNAKSKASNAIDINFTIVEPYGMTLLDRLMSAAETTAKCTNYVDLPYLLEIDFISNVEENQSGKNLIEQKRIPIKIRDLKIKPGPGGTEYKVAAIPYNHSVFDQTISSLPINIAVEAKTVGEFFASDTTFSKAPTGELQSVDKERVEQEYQTWFDSMSNYVGTPSEEDAAAFRSRVEGQYGYVATSLAGGYNEHMIQVAKKAKLFKDPPVQIAFEIHEKFKNSPILQDRLTNASKTIMTPISESVQKTISRNIPAFKDKQLYNLHAGSDIVSIIDRVMQSSQYITDQVQAVKQEVESGKKPTRTLDWYKIVPKIQIKNFDYTQNAWTKLVTYCVEPYSAVNAFHPDFLKTEIKKEKPVRVYNYLYTGKNEDIVSIDIDFNFLYYTAMMSYQESKIRTGSRFGTTDAEVKEESTPQVRDGIDNKRTSMLPVTTAQTASDQQTQHSVNRGQRTEDQAVSSLIKSIYSGVRGDMLNVNLRIVGDPAFIKQDDIYYAPGTPEYNSFIAGADANFESNTPPINPETGQIIFDTQQVMVQLVIKSAVDIDDNTGITNKQIKLSNDRMTDSTFSGVYRVYVVRSELSRGKFEQVLTLLRLPDDILDEAFFVNSSNTNVDTLTPKVEPAIAPSVAVATPPPAVVDGLAGVVATRNSLQEAANSAATQIAQATDAVQQTAGDLVKQAQTTVSNAISSLPTNFTI